MDDRIETNIGRDVMTATEIIKQKLLAVIYENYSIGRPLDKGTAIKIVCDKFRLTESDARHILLALNRAGIVGFGKRRVLIVSQGSGQKTPRTI